MYQTCIFFSFFDFVCTYAGTSEKNKPEFSMCGCLNQFSICHIVLLSYCMLQYSCNVWENGIEKDCISEPHPASCTLFATVWKPDAAIYANYKPHQLQWYCQCPFFWSVYFACWNSVIFDTKLQQLSDKSKTFRTVSWSVYIVCWNSVVVIDTKPQQLYNGIVG